VTRSSSNADVRLLLASQPTLSDRPGVRVPRSQTAAAPGVFSSLTPAMRTVVLARFNSDWAGFAQLVPVQRATIHSASAVSVMDRAASGGIVESALFVERGGCRVRGG
jgi:hypothetical protein